MILSFMDKMTTETQSFGSFIRNIVLVVSTAATSRTGGLASVLTGTADITDIPDITHSLDHDKSSSISQLMTGKSRDLQKLLKYFKGTATSAFNILLSSGVLPLNFVLYSKDFLVTVSCYLSYN